MASENLYYNVRIRNVTITGLMINHDKIPRLVLPFHFLIIIKTVFDYISR